jgi:hypothetical protein
MSLLELPQRVVLVATADLATSPLLAATDHTGRKTHRLA